MTVYVVTMHDIVRDVVTERETAIQTAKYLISETFRDWERIDTKAVACWKRRRDRIVVTEHDEATADVWDGEKR